MNSTTTKIISIEHTKKTIAGAYSFVKNNISANSKGGTSFTDTGVPNAGKDTAGEESSA